MIFKIDNSLKNMEGKAAKEKELADFILNVSKKQHNLDCSSDMWKWLEEHVLVSRYLGDCDRVRIHRNIQLLDLTSEKSRYLSTVTVGEDEGMFSPAEADKLLCNPSLVIVENEQNDWAVIRKWIDLLKNDRKYKNVNTLVCKRKDANELMAYNAGSSGQIINTIVLRQSVYGSAAMPYKVTAVIDSDKKNASEDLSNEKKKILAAMDEAGIEGHILLKREMENYFPEKVYRDAGMIAPGVSLQSYPPERWDFIDIEGEPHINYQKKQLPMLTQYLDKPSLLSRVDIFKVSYDGESMNEIQMIILKLAKLC